jgi:DNA-binding NarL/FixJ family response regulator
MDYRLPDGDGAHTAGAIKERVPEAQIVMLTASADEPVLVEAIDAGCSGFITKDRALDEVTSAVRAAAAGEALISPAMLAHLLPRLRGGTRSGPGSTLTQREMQVLELMAHGMSNQEIAAQLVLALNTVRNHVQSLLGKLGAHSKLEAVATAARQGWVKFPES